MATLVSEENSIVLNGRATLNRAGMSCEITGDIVLVKSGCGRVTWRLNYKTDSLNGSTYDTVQKLFDALRVLIKGGGAGGNGGAGLHIDASGTLSGRSAYDEEDVNFAYLDSENEELYYKQSVTSGDWSPAIPVGKGDSAYEIAVKLGFVGTVDQYEQSLRQPGIDASVKANGAIPQKAPSLTITHAIGSDPKTYIGNKGTYILNGVSNVLSDEINYIFWNGSAWSTLGVGIDLAYLFEDKADTVVGKNLLDKNKMTTGIAVKVTDGNTSSNSNYSCSDYIPVIASLPYFLSGNGNGTVAWYNAAKVFISGSDGGYPREAPTGAEFARVNSHNNNKNTAQFEQNTIATAYEPYVRALKNDLKKEAVSVNNLKTETKEFISGLAEIETGKYFGSFNIFDKTKVTEGFYTDQNNKISTNVLYALSDYMRVKPQTSYYINGAGAWIYVTYFDKYKKFISGVSQPGVGLFTTPEWAYFARTNALMTHLNTAQVEEGSVFTSYHPYKVVLKKELLEASPFGTLKWNAIGDSITWPGGYVTKVSTDLGFLETRNYGLNGGELAKDNSFGLAVKNRISAMDSDAQVITVFAGINDFKNGTTNLGTFEDLPTVVSIYGALKSVCSQLVEKYPAAHVFYISPMQCGGSYVNAEGLNTKGNHLIDYRDAINKVCSYYSIPVIDLTAEAGINNKNITSYSSDSLHPNALGIKRISTLIINKMREFILI